MVMLTDQQRAFIAQAEQFYSDFGLPPSAGKVLGYLLICEPACQSEGVIRQTLELSTGGANNAVRTLTEIGLVSRSKQSGGRKLYYEITPGIWQELFKRRLSMGERAYTLAKEGLELSPDSVRLKEMYDFYAAIETRMRKALLGLFDEANK